MIFERLAADQATIPGGMSYDEAADQLTVYAKAGMRTLCLAYKTISRSEYEDWNARYSQAHASMEELVKRRQGRENAIDPLMNEIERDLILLGVTAVQDKLQAGVPATLRLLQETKIKVWTLTGDKMETAVNIGYASALLSHDMDVQQIGGDDYSSTAAALKELSQRSEASLTSSSSRSKGGRGVRRRSHDARRRPRSRTNSFLGSAKAAISEFFFGSTAKHKRKQNENATEVVVRPGLRRSAKHRCIRPLRLTLSVPTSSRPMKNHCMISGLTLTTRQSTPLSMGLSLEVCTVAKSVTRMAHHRSS